MATVSFSGIQKAYDQVQVLHHIDLEVQDGEFVVLVGPSGCGKSTLLRCVAGLETISSGELQIDGRRVNDVAPRDRDVAMVFQSYALYPHMTVAQNMGFALKIRKVPQPKIDEAVRSAAELLGLSHLLDRRPAQMSGGQRQRVAMGRAIVRDPKVFLFDEPLSNLDAALRNQMRVELKRLHKRLDATILYVTHDQVEALTLADRIVVLEKGVLQQVGTPQDLYDTPANRFVAGFIGSPAMNFLDARGADGRVEAEGLSLAHSHQGPATLGIRPHDVLVGADAPAGPGTVEAEIEFVEQLGWEVHLHLKVGAQHLTARTEADKVGRPTPGQKIPARLGRSHLFDPMTGAAIARVGA